MNQGDAEKIIDDVAAAGQKAADKAKRSASEAMDAASDKIAVARDRAVSARFPYRARESLCPPRIGQGCGYAASRQARI